MGTLRMFLRKSFAVFYTVFFVAAVFSVGNMFVVAAPPPSGDWIINDTESCSDQTIVLNGSLIVEGSGNLTFRRGVTLKLNCTYDGQYNITVNDGGKFYLLEGSIITSVDSAKKYSFIVRIGSTFRMSDSELHQCGGLDISSDHAVIENSLISHNLNGMWIFGSGVVVRNNNITANERSGVVVWGKDRSPAIYNNSVSLNNDSGIGLGSGASPTIYNNTITSNLGDGICMGNATPIIRNNFITKNRAGIVSSDSSPAILNNTITSNRGEGIISKRGSPTVSNNVITSNLGAGVACIDQSSPTIQSNNVSQNNGDGVSVGVNCSPTIYNNTITSNLANGVSMGYSNATVKTNIVTNNRWGIRCAWYSDARIEGNDITSNIEVGITINTYSSPIVLGNLIASHGFSGISCGDPSRPIIQGNQIMLNSHWGITCFNRSQPEIHWNDIYDGANNGDPTVIINATYNYWSRPEGPEVIPQNALYNPWLTEPIVFTEITNPLSGETISATVMVSTNARAKNGLYKVEFYIDDQVKYTDLDSPYEWNWDTVQYTETPHEVTAKAYDIYGLEFSVSRTVFVDNTSPMVSIREPPSGSMCYGMMTISVNATDNREVSTVRVKVDNGAWLIMTYNSTDSHWKVYAFNTTTLSDGQHALMVLALDRAGNPATTSITVLIDNNPPALSIQSPTSGMTVGLTLIVNVQANDISNISRVEFHLHNVLVHTAYTTPYQWAWDTTKYPNGEYTITVKAYDAIGNVKSRDIAVTVNNVEVPWWQANFWAIIQAVTALGALMLGVITFWLRTREKRSKKKTKEPTNVSSTNTT